MNYISITIFTLIFLTTEQSVTPECDKFKTGIFLLEDTITNKLYRIERTDSLQIENTIGSNDTTKFRITWINECQYELRIVEGKVGIMDFYRDRILRLEIIETYENGYKFRASFNDLGIEYIQTVRRFKD